MDFRCINHLDDQIVYPEDLILANVIYNGDTLCIDCYKKTKDAEIKLAKELSEVMWNKES